jgi:enamine deaminase RidA (YjgF/YER057c/UK114 family)
MKQMKQAIRPEDIPKPVMHYSSCIRVGDLVFTSGALATDYRSGLAPEADLPYLGSNIKHQTRVVFRAINKLVTAADSSLENIVKLDEFLDDWNEGALYFEERNQNLPEVGPAASTVVVNPFIIPSCNLEVDALAFTNSSGFKKEVVRTGNAPQGPDPQAVKAGPWIFVSGMMATDYESGVAPEAQVNKNNWYGSEIKAQARLIFKNLASILEEAGSSLEQVVKVRVDMIDLHDFSGFEEVWNECFPKAPPARSVVRVNAIGAVGCRIQINATAVTKDGGIKIETVNAPGIAPQPSNEPHAIKAGGLLFLSGQMPFDEKGLAQETKLHPAVPYYGQSVKKQMSYTLERVRTICQAGGSSLDNMVKRLVFHTDITELDQSFEAWKEYFREAPPASTTVEVEGPHLVPGSTILLDLIAAIPG